MPATEDWNAYRQARREEVELLDGGTMVVKDAGILYGAEVLGPMLESLGDDVKTLFGALKDISEMSAADLKEAIEKGELNPDGTVPGDTEAGPKDKLTAGLMLVARVLPHVPLLARAVLPYCIVKPRIVLDERIAIDKETGKLKPNMLPLDDIAPWDMILLIVKSLNIAGLLRPEVMSTFRDILPDAPGGDKPE